MIVKSIGVKQSGAFGRLTDYIFRKDAIGEKEPVYIRYNVFGTLEEIARQFADVESGRLYERKGANRFLHTIISLSEMDREKVTVEMLADLAYKYLSLLNENAVAYGTVHMHDNPHSHLIIAGCDLEGKAMRISKADFQRVKSELQAYQEERYPELVHSIVEHGQGKQYETDAEYQMKLDGRVQNKDAIRQVVSSAFELAHSREEFFELLKKEDGLETYERGGEVKGIDADRHYRFSTLDRSIDMRELDRREERLQELEGDASFEHPAEKEVSDAGDQLYNDRLNELDELQNH